jgi:hypothetical protein
MAGLLFILLLSSFGGVFLLHYLKNFLLKERRKFYLDWDGLLERLCITYIIIALPDLWMLIFLIIALKALVRLLLLGFVPGIAQTREPGAASQKVLLKSELAFDLFLSPAFAILIGVIFK